jgi:hypothetical protein
MQDVGKITEKSVLYAISGNKKGICPESPFAESYYQGRTNYGISIDSEKRGDAQDIRFPS